MSLLRTFCIPLTVFFFVLLPACIQRPNNVPPAPETVRPALTKPATTPSPNITLLKPRTKPQAPQLPKQKPLSISYGETRSEGVTLWLCRFDDRSYQLRVADQPKGVGSRWETARDAAATYRGVAAINGGFFSPEGKPIGALIETGTRRGNWNSSSLGRGVFVSGSRGSAILRTSRYRKSPGQWPAYNLLQTGPMLIEQGKSVSGLSKERSRPRSFLLWDGRHHWAIGQASSCTLAQLSKALEGKTIYGIQVQTAINLDGGRSADLWVSPQITGGGASKRSFINRTVRNYLVLEKK